MKLSSLTLISLFLSPAAFALELKDLVGTWNTTFEAVLGDGFDIQGQEHVIYKPNGKFESSDGSFIVQTENHFRALSLTSQNKGEWQLKDDRLHLTTKEEKIDFCSSWLENMSRKEIEESFAESSQEIEVYSLVSQTKNKLVFKEDENNIKVTMTRSTPSSPINAKKDDPTVRQEVKQDPQGMRYRRFTRQVLNFEGFTAAKGLPTFKRRAGLGGKLRSQKEIINRLLCNYLVISWVALPEDRISKQELLDLAKKNQLEDHLTESEQKILDSNREEAATQFIDSIGWKLENVWALAWVLGFEFTPEVYDRQIDQETITDLFRFLTPALEGRKELVKNISPRSLEEVAQLEDIFYCAHNAVRSAQNGNPETVPKNFDPVAQGGIIHEKRHSLTWALTPKVKWEKTDLST